MSKIEILGATKDELQIVRDGLKRHREKVLMSAQNVPPVYFNRCIKEGGEVVGGAFCVVLFGDTLFVDILWVREDCRGKGYATALIADAERLGIDAGCNHAVLDTFNFQARGLYEKLGYSVYAALNGFPQGQIDYHMSKKLTTSEESPVQQVQIHNATDEEVEKIVQGLVAYNNSQSPFTQDPHFVNFHRTLKADGEIVGGIIGEMYCWKVFTLYGLWVKEEERGKEYAQMLMKDTEKWARDFGCTLIHLETYNPKMRQLCEKLGYTTYGVLPNHPKGHEQFYMSKKITQEV